MNTNHRPSPLAATLSLCAALLGFGALQAQAAPGDLDSTFGTGGRAVIATGGTTAGNAVAVQADGKVVIAGYPGMARFSAAGVPDGTFGAGGFLATNNRHFSVVAFGGKLITSSLGFDGVQRITRYLDNGSVDTSFGSSGSFTRNAANSAGMMLIALHADGRIVYVTTDEFGPSTRAVYAGRLTANGTVDATFNGGNLRQILSFGANLPGTIRLQSDGQVLVAGTSGSSFFVAYLNPDGTMASGFGTGGVALTEQGAIESEVGLQLSPAGIFISGTSWAGGSNYDFTVIRLAWANGAVQQVARAGFGQSDIASALFMYDDGQLIVAGTADDLGQSRFAMIRFNANFTLDTSFGTGGKVLDTGSIGHARAIVRQPDGKFIIAGEDNADNFMAQRYDGRLTSTIALSATPFATNPGQEAGLVATLPGVQGGTVDFRDGGVTIPGCAAQPVVFGAALCTTSSLPSGTHTITGNYSGDGYFLPSSSATFPYAVRYLFNIVIEGGQEVPAAATTALGTGTITIDTVANQLVYDLSFSGLSSSEVGAHIHGFSGRGINSGILHTLPAGSPKFGAFAYSEGQEASLVSGQAYVNIHSTNFPGGEIRGQIDNQGGLPKNLSVTLAGAGAAFGTVSGTGIFCPGDCFEQYAHGTNVTLTASATQGTPFVGWSGACSGTGTCNVTMSLARSVTATFGAAPPLLSRMHYRLGEDDPGAGSGALGLPTTQSSAETPGWQMFRQGAPLYTQGAGSIGSLGMHFPAPLNLSIIEYRRPDSAFGGLSNNLGVEAWVRTEGALTMDATIASVGAPNGFALIRSGGNYMAHLGGLGSTQGGPVVVSRWTHIAMTHIAGTTRFYLNGVETGAPLVSASPTISIFNSSASIAGRGPIQGGDFVGTIDAVRFFTLQPGTFSPLELNVRPYTAFKLGTGTGSVTANAGGIACDAFSCNGFVPTGTVVTLSANPDAGTTFGGWDGCESVTAENRCVITVQVGMSVSAAFNVPSTNRSPLDLNGDRRSDILWRDASGRAALWLMDGTATVDAALLMGPSTGWTIENASGDFDGDGRADILWKRTDGTWAVWLMNGMNATNISLLLSGGSGWSITHVGDFDGDGKSDLLWTHPDGSVSIWLMNGVTQADASIILGPGTPWSVTHVADLNNDARTDIVWKHTDGTVAAWLMDGISAIDVGVVFGGGTSWLVTHTGDFDGNGTHDLLFRDGGGQLAIYLMNGLATLNAAIVYGGGPFDISHVANFDGNTTSDLLFKDAGGRLAIWLMNGLSATDVAIVFSGGGGWVVTHIGDYDGDGKADLLFKDGSGQVAIWLMNGTTVTAMALAFDGTGGWVAAP